MAGHSETASLFPYTDAVFEASSTSPSAAVISAEVRAAGVGVDEISGTVGDGPVTSDATRLSNNPSVQTSTRGDLPLASSTTTAQSTGTPIRTSASLPCITSVGIAHSLTNENKAALSATSAKDATSLRKHATLGEIIGYSLGLFALLCLLYFFLVHFKVPLRAMRAKWTSHGLLPLSHNPRSPATAGPGNRRAVPAHNSQLPATVGRPATHGAPAGRTPAMRQNALIAVPRLALLRETVRSGGAPAGSPVTPVSPAPPYDGGARPVSAENAPAWTLSLGEDAAPPGYAN